MRIPFIGLGVKQKSSNVTAQRRVNLYLEIKNIGDRYNIVAYGTPGKELFVNFGDTQCRGSWAQGDFMYQIHRGTWWEVNNAGVMTSRGTFLTTSGRCDIAGNGAQIGIVDGTYMYIYTIATNTLARVTDPDLPANPTTIAFNDGYFIIGFADSGRYYISAPYDGTNIDALDFTTAESNPDDTVRVYVDHGEVIAFGEVTTEFHGNTGATDFPYSRIGVAIEWGLAARWSVAKFDNSIMYLGKNRMGEVQVVRLNGYTPQPIQDHDFCNAINSYSATSDATAYSYMLDGHPMYVINFPTAGKTWLYDGSTQAISELVSDGLTRDRAEIHVNYLSRNYVTDYTNGKVYRLRNDVYTENGAPIRRTLVGKNFDNNLNRLSILQFELEMERGVGLATGQGSDPQVMLRYSNDGGHTWSDELWNTMGAIGEYDTRVQWNRLGRAYEFVFEVSISDPVKVTIMGASVEAR